MLFKDAVTWYYAASVMDEWVWAIGGMILTAETDVLGEIKLSQLHLVYYKSSALTGLVLNPHLRGDRPATNLLSQGMARQFAEKLAVDRSQVQGNDPVGETWKRRTNYETWKARVDFLFGRSRVWTVTRRPAIVRFFATCRQMPGQRLKFGYCLFLVRPFNLYWLTSPSLAAV